MQTNTRIEHGYQIHEITAESGDLSVIRLRNDRLLTVDPGSNAVHFNFREVTEAQHRIDVAAALHLEGALELTVVCDAGSARINAVEIIP